MQFPLLEILADKLVWSTGTMSKSGRRELLSLTWGFGLGFGGFVVARIKLLLLFYFIALKFLIPEYHTKKNLDRAITRPS